MVAATFAVFAQPAELTDAIELLAIVVVVISLVVVSFVRSGRNRALEDIVASHKLRLPVMFDGTLVAEEHKPGAFLRLSKSTRSAQMLQLQYRWLGVGPQSIYDEIVFDAARGLVAFRKKAKQTSRPFSDFSAIRMQEKYGGRGSGYWNVELVPHKGRTTPLISSQRGDRQTEFELTVPVTKAASAITGLPVQVCVVGNVWTPGWPPKSAVAPEP